MSTNESKTLPDAKAEQFAPIASFHTDKGRGMAAAGAGTVALAGAGARAEHIHNTVTNVGH